MKWLNGLFKNRKSGAVQDAGSSAEANKPSTLSAKEHSPDVSDGVAIDAEEKQPHKVMLIHNKFPKKRKPWSTVKKAVVFSCAGVAAAAVIAVGIWAAFIMIDPLAQFNTGNDDAEQTNTQAAAVTGGTVGEATPTATIDPEDALLSQADLSILESNYINIMLIGVDHADERDSDDWTGKTDFHSDVMIVLTINRTTGKVSMISLPRDTYAKIPGVDGVYKLNASINCGGGWPTEEGFEKVCQAAQWMLGGSGSKDDPIVIPYYFAVDMEAVKALVDKIGGVDYDVDISFTIQGRSYTKGEQHMNGQAVLDYLRVRKEASGSHEGISSDDADGATGDPARVDRQKKMLVAIFEKIKSNGLLASIPSLIDAFDGSLYYNMSVSQIAALAWYAYGVDSNDIQMYSMSGTYNTLFGDFAFTITDQTNRQDIIKEVYGIDVPKRTSYMANAAKLLWGQMQAEQFTKVAKPILKQVKALLEDDALLPVEPTPTPAPSPTPASTPIESEGSGEEATPTPSPTPTPTGWLTSGPISYRKYGDEEWALYNRVLGEYEAALNAEDYDSGDDLLALVVQLKTDVISLCGMFGIEEPSEKDWDENFQKNYNEIYVDFR
jgi:LCP family protein required for cell wall assembly